MKKRIAILSFIFTILLSLTTDVVLSKEDSGDSNGDIGFNMCWEPNELLLLDGENVSSNLHIEYSGPPFTADLSIEVGRGIEYTGNIPESLILSDSDELDLELHILAEMEEQTTLMTSKVLANVSNATFSLEEKEELDIKILLPMDVEHPVSWDVEHWNATRSPERFIRERQSQYNGETGAIYLEPILKNAASRISFQVTNCYQNREIQGFFNLTITDYFKDEFEEDPSSVEDRFILRDQRYVIDPKESINLVFQIEPPAEDDWWKMEMSLMFSSSFSNTEGNSTYNLLSIEGGMFIGAVENTFKRPIVDDLQIQISSRTERGSSCLGDDDKDKCFDFWNGTPLSIIIVNGKTHDIKDPVLVIEDLVGKLIAFDYEKYHNGTSIKIEDLRSSEVRIINLTCFSKTSGHHFFKAYLEGYPEIVSTSRYGHGYEVVFQNSGLSLSYLSDRLYGKDGQIYIRQPETRVGEELNLEIEINNPKRYKGTFGFDIYVGKMAHSHNHLYRDEEVHYEPQPTGTFPFPMHGNGWLTKDSFIEISGDQRIEAENETLKIRVRTKISCCLRLIPYIELDNGTRLMFDHNHGNRIPETCIDQGRWGGIPDYYLQTVEKVKVNPRIEPNYTIIYSFLTLTLYTSIIWTIISKYVRKQKWRPKKEKGGKERS